jgi:hypothetical protein
MTTATVSESNADIRLLTDEEANAVTGGILPFIIAGELFALGFMGGVVACNIKNDRPWFEW